MIGDGFFSVSRDSFANQFEADGKEYLYHRSLRDAPVRISVAERDVFINRFRLATRYLFWGLMAGFLLVVAGVMVVDGNHPSEAHTWVGVGALSAVFIGCYMYAWNEPARILRGRGFSGEGRSRAEVRRLMLQKLTYGQLSGIALTVVALVWRVSKRQDIFSGWSRLYLGFAAVMVVAILLQAFRKWRFESRKD